MQRNTTRAWHRALLTLAAAACLAAPGLAKAAPPAATPADEFDPKVDTPLALVAKEARKHGGPQALVHVIAYGDAADALARLGATDVERLSLIDGYSATMRISHLNPLAHAHGIDHITVDSPVEPTGTVVSAGSLVTLFPLVDNAPAAWNLGLTGEGAIAVVDSGVSPNPDLGSRLTQIAASSNITTLGDDVGHGTFVATVAAGQSPDGRHLGIAPNATVYGVKVASPAGTYTSDIVNGLTWIANNATAKGIKVVILSLAETNVSNYQTNALDQAVETLWRNGIVVVISSGNNGPDTASYAPANDPFVITVGASDSNDTLDTSDDYLATFSTYGTTLDGFAKPEIVAPGRHIVADEPAGAQLDLMAPPENHVEPGYLMMNGTSFSAPQVSAAALLLLQQHPTWTPNQVKGVLLATERPVSGSSAGALDLGAATAFAGTPPSSNQGVASATGSTITCGAAGTCSSSFNSSASNDAQATERAARAYEAQGKWSNAAQAWASAASIWGPKVGNWQGEGLDTDKASADFLLANDPGHAAGVYNNAAGDFQKISAWQMVAVAWDKQAGVQLGQKKYPEAAGTWEKSAQAMAKSTTPDWAAVAWESAASARG